jgi:hypothetical protein
MSKGSSGSTSQVELSPEQRAQIAAQTKFFTDTIAPTYNEAVKGATQLYNTNAGGVGVAAENQAKVARQAQESLGGTGESALRTGISGLQNLFSPDYERTQIQAALMPAQAQYAQNIANQDAQFGASGNMGSAREALASRQLAGATQGAQMQAAANIQQQIAGQRAGVANQLAQLGQGGIGQALGAAGNAVSASMVPQQLYNQYASVIFGTPSASYNPDFRGTQSSSTTGESSSITGQGIGALGSLIGGAAKMSDRRVKENIKHIHDVDGIRVYSFNYVWDKTPTQGAMAQDLLEDARYADAVSVHESGFYQVDYAKLPELH